MSTCCSGWDRCWPVWHWHHPERNSSHDAGSCRPMVRPAPPVFMGVRTAVSARQIKRKQQRAVRVDVPVIMVGEPRGWGHGEVTFCPFAGRLVARSRTPTGDCHARSGEGRQQGRMKFGSIGWRAGTYRCWLVPIGLLKFRKRSVKGCPLIAWYLMMVFSTPNWLETWTSCWSMERGRPSRPRHCLRRLVA